MFLPLWRICAASPATFWGGGLPPIELHVCLGRKFIFYPPPNEGVPLRRCDLYPDASTSGKFADPLHTVRKHRIRVGHDIGPQWVSYSAPKGVLRDAIVLTPFLCQSLERATPENPALRLWLLLRSHFPLFSPDITEMRPGATRTSVLAPPAWRDSFLWIRGVFESFFAVCDRSPMDLFAERILVLLSFVTRGSP